MIYFPLILIFACSILLTYFYIHHAHQKNWLDVPNQRSSHTKVTPRGGGLVFIVLWLIAGLLALPFHFWTWQQALVLWPSTLLVAIIGFCDDRYTLSARWRALGYFAAAIISVTALGNFSQLAVMEHLFLPLFWFGSIVAVFAIVWSANLFNFMDGLDGIAAMEALFTLGLGGYFFWQAGGQGMALITWLLAAAVAGFFVWNKPPAQVFMGDVGSATLGFIVMVLALLGEKQWGVPLLLWLIVYSAFIFDATITLARRFLAKEPVYQAHRLHAYQRLHQAGYTHAQVLIRLGIVDIILSLLALLGFYHRDWMMPLVLLAAVFLGLLYWRIEKLKPMYHSKKN